MKKYIILFLSAFLVTLLLGCAAKKKEPVQPPTKPKAEEKVKPEEPKPEEEEVITGEEELKESLQNIYFDFDKYFLRSEAKETLAKNAEYLKANLSVKIKIEGHCDERGTVEYNLALGEKRARSAMEYLINLGIEPKRISIISYGKERPVDPGHNEEAWAKNRRDEFVIITR
jgi:peptidoglycan-associated lipoprotein